MLNSARLSAWWLSRTDILYAYTVLVSIMRPPLTSEELRSIQDRNLQSADVRALLWEIKRLRALTLRSHDYFKQSPTSSMAMMLAQALLRDLNEEPVVKEQPRIL